MKLLILISEGGFFMREKLTDSEKWKKRKMEMLYKFNFKCFYCLGKIDLQNLHIDHYIPKSKGGIDKDENLVASCIKCNLSKNGKTVEDWLKRSIVLMKEFNKEYFNKREMVKNLKRVLKNCY